MNAHPLRFTLLFMFSGWLKPVQAQSETWFFGNQAGIEFNTTGASPVCDGKLNSSEGSAVATDASGALLFYTDGRYLYNNAHNPVSFNGKTDFMGGSPSSTHSALILPLPGSGCTEYLIFTSDASENLEQSGYRGFECVRVGVNGTSVSVLEGPVSFNPTDPVSGKKYLSTEKIAATSDGNQGFWVLHHLTGVHAGAQRTFMRLHVTPQTQTLRSLLPDAMLFEAGSPHVGYRRYTYAVQGQMKFSPDGTKLALVVPELIPSSTYTDNFAEIFQFDPVKGIISGVAATIERTEIVKTTGITGPVKNLYGVAFSPNSGLLYLSEGYSPSRETFNGLSTFYGNVYQFDLNAANVLQSVSVVATFHSYDKTNANANYYPCGALQTGPDQKIYIARPGRNYISRIENPDTKSSGIQITEQAVLLINSALSGCKNKLCNLGLPTVCLNAVCSAEAKMYCPCQPDYSLNLRTEGSEHYIDLLISSHGACVKNIKLSLLSSGFQNDGCMEHSESHSDNNKTEFIHSASANFNGIQKRYLYNGQLCEWSKWPNLGNLDHQIFVAPIQLPLYDPSCGQGELCFKLEITTCNCQVCEKTHCLKYGDPLPEPGENLVVHHESPATAAPSDKPYREIHIYPNPVSELFEVAHTLTGDEFEILLFNTNGQIIYRERTESRRITLQMALKSGVYQIVVSNRKGQNTRARMTVTGR